jgi:hypothetical protein
VTEGLKIVCLRPGLYEKIDVVFTSKAENQTAKTHTKWATAQMPGRESKETNSTRSSAISSQNRPCWTTKRATERPYVTTS